RRYGGVRASAATPRARSEERVLRERAHEVLAALGLDDAANVRVTELPGPQQRLVAVAASLAAAPTVLLLDEPAAGGSPADVDRLAAVLRDVREHGTAVVLVEHNLRLVRRVAERVVVMNAGRVIADGPPADVAMDETVRAAYLGRGNL